MVGLDNAKIPYDSDGKINMEKMSKHTVNDLMIKSQGTLLKTSKRVLLLFRRVFILLQERSY